MQRIKGNIMKNVCDQAKDINPLHFSKYCYFTYWHHFIHAMSFNWLYLSQQVFLHIKLHVSQWFDLWHILHLKISICFGLQMSSQMNLGKNLAKDRTYYCQVQVIHIWNLLIKIAQVQQKYWLLFLLPCKNKQIHSSAETFAH